MQIILSLLFSMKQSAKILIFTNVARQVKLTLILQLRITLSSDLKMTLLLLVQNMSCKAWDFLHMF